ncbi:MAG: DNA gyrase/topoisomerase IV subunit A [Muribaculaceae bacterium]|nr:DNA gyrase/topoisomerase IV subunit A [Muribaculaceae bacterium]
MKEDNEELELNNEEPINEGEGTAQAEQAEDAAAGHSGYQVPKDKKLQLSGMYENWFLDYASYVILERAVPHIEDGFKPVQRRIMHAMKEADDGHMNKVANLVGMTMQYHPHGDASIYSALVQLGQKELLIDTQGNWGNILTGDGAAAGRYIEARLSEFALDTVYNAKVTDWGLSYDGRKREPLTLPAKFPLLLAQGAEGIAVGLSCKILPHNFNEIIDAAVHYLRNEEFHLYPDFQTGGYIDVSHYNDGERGGSVRVRTKIEKIDNKTLLVKDVPYGKTTGSLMESIVKAAEKGKIKVKRVDDNTSENAEIIVQLQPGTSSDIAIDALYAFSDCEISISPNCCVIKDEKPQFLTVSDVLRYSVDRTKDILRKELEIQRGETLETLHGVSLEKIFIEERIYKDRQFENAANMDAAVAHIDKRLEPYKPKFIREVTREDILKLMEIKMARILKFNIEKAENYIATLNERIADIDYKLEHLVEHTINWYEGLKAKYGHKYPRKTIIREFDTIVAAKVAEASEKLYINRADGFVGTGLKKDEYVCNCSDIDDIILFYKDGKYKVTKVAEKIYVGKNVIYVNVFKRNDSRTVYNVLYQDGKGGTVFMKRFAVTGITRDREYDLTQGKPGSKVMWFTANPNGEAEVLRITLKPKFRLKVLQFDIDLAELAIKGKQSRGNIVTKNDIHRISLKSAGASTLGDREVWFDPDILRINYEGHGRSLGLFGGEDRILVIMKNGDFYTTSSDASNHYEEGILRIEKYQEGKIWTAIVDDADQGYLYVKRFPLEDNAKKQSMNGSNEASKLILLSDEKYPRFNVKFGGGDEFREPLVIDAEEYIAVKSFKAKGKRVSNYEVAEVTEIEPREVPEEELPAEPQVVEPEVIETPEEPKPEPPAPVLNATTGQWQLFGDEADDENVDDSKENKE